MLNYAIPIIEILASGELGFGSYEIKEQVQKRRKIAQAISSYLQGGGDKEGYFYALGQLLESQKYLRLLFYLPLSDLRLAPEWFHGVFLKAWHELLNVYDVRENFFEGDTYEVDARPNGELERVVKCAHLTPWLVEAEYLNYSDLRQILSLNQDNEILLRSFANTWRIIRDQKLLAAKEMDVLEGLTAHVNQRAQLHPLYISDRRQKWLSERGREARHEELLTPDAKLEGPFSPNMPKFMKELGSLQNSLEPEEVVLVGGSRLKGYGLKMSDFDVFNLRRLSNSPIMTAGSVHAVHLYFNALWIGGNKVKHLKELAMNHASIYFREADCSTLVERLESDLLLYRLLHKGFSRFCGGYSSAAKDYPEMDGNCPFYDDQYRRIATELFAKYVFIPTIS